MKITGEIILFPGKVIVKNTGKMLKNMRRTVKIIRRNKWGRIWQVQNEEEKEKEEVIEKIEEDKEFDKENQE